MTEECASSQESAGLSCCDGLPQGEWDAYKTESFEATGQLTSQDKAGQVQPHTTLEHRVASNVCSLGFCSLSVLLVLEGWQVRRANTLQTTEVFSTEKNIF